MRTFLTIIASMVLVGSALAKTALAQVGIQSEIIVPRQSVFTGSTTITVPDRGYTSLGGFRGASSTRNELRPGLSSGFARNAVAQEAGARVWIHDFEELEPNGPGGNAVAASATSDFASALRRFAAKPVARTDQQERTTSSASARAVNDSLTAPLRERESEENVAVSLNEYRAAEFLKLAQDAESSGKPTVARIHYQAAARLAPAPSSQVAQDRLAAIEVQRARR